MVMVMVMVTKVGCKVYFWIVSSFAKYIANKMGTLVSYQFQKTFCEANPLLERNTIYKIKVWVHEDTWKS